MPSQFSGRAERRSRTERASLRQMQILKSGVGGHYDPHASAHYFAKHHALDCGRPQCPLCANPRHNRFFKGDARLTIQELRVQDSAKQEIQALSVKRSHG
jgi:hypothetical protein